MQIRLLTSKKMLETKTKIVVNQKITTKKTSAISKVNCSQFSAPKKTLLLYFVHNSNYNNYIPLDIGYVISNLKKNNLDLKTRVMPLLINGKKSEEVNWNRLAMKIPFSDFDTIIFFLDNILWSGNYYEISALNLAIELKKLSPNLQIGLHSYKIREKKSLEILKQNTQIDFVLRGEPERSIYTLLTQKNPAKVPNFSFRKKSIPIATEEIKPLSDLSLLPSPYLIGLFDDFLKKYHKYQQFLVASRGCPYRCHYCFRSIKFDSIRTFPAERVISEIRYMQERGVGSIFFLDDTFAPTKKYLDELVSAYQKEFIKNKGPKLTIMTRPELLSGETLAKFASLNVTQVQVGLQTLNPDLQYLITRAPNFKLEKTFLEIAKLSKKNGIELCIDTIFGLPGDTLEYFKKTLNFATSLRPWRMQIKQVYLNPNTRFEIYPEKYGIVSGEDRLTNVPFVKSSKGWTPTLIKKAFLYAVKIRRKNPKIGFKIYSEHGYYCD